MRRVKASILTCFWAVIAVPGKRTAKDRLARTVRIGQLLALYGPLLTERQREFVRLHHDEDMSLGEIAKDFGISRQAVHDAVRQAEAAMERYETGLGLLAKRPAGGGAGETAGDPLPRRNLRQAIKQIEAVRERLASQGIIYDVAEFVRGLDAGLERLRGLTK